MLFPFISLVKSIGLCGRESWSLRVIAGKNRGHKLAELSGGTIRPTADRVREAVFSMLYPYLSADTTVLDLFGGTGALAIEALSRGARMAHIVDQSASSCSVIETNLKATKNNSAAILFHQDAISFLMQAKEQYSLIFLDPPYAKGLIGQALPIISRRGLLAPEGVIMAECGYEESFPKTDGLRILKQKKYGRTVVALYTHAV